MDQKKTMLLDWMRKIHQLEYAHCFQSLYYSKLEKRIGISAFVLSTLVAFSYRFPAVENICFNTYFFFLKKEYLLPFILLVVALLTGLQTFLKPNEKAENHRKIGLEYEKIRHNIEIVLTKEQTETEIDLRIKEVKKKWDVLNTVYVDDKYFAQGKEKVKSFKKYPKELSFLPDIEEKK
ncbi:SLATT domain-containing protein [Flavobacterium sp. LM4]|uniref:SLATT domain-containing protein n=1 Tax=Flavobacterium sp. LM4 TaxID=1938609 RepID=UPI000992CFA4|nr:SLATT domain-containing protein [Flavobacterium sp. LM4]OOV19250.1 hypothetical protein BXU10_06155 [Flavobacterium sp. LM4]